jgi:hypothetical protein
MSRENSVISGNSVIRQTEIYRKRMVRLKIDLKREIKEKIKDRMGTRPLKNIPFSPFFAQTRMTVTKLDVFKGLDYSALYQGNTIGPMSLSQIYSVRQVDYKAL